jgi:hydrogenase expression/formation protein HypC
MGDSVTFLVNVRTFLESSWFDGDWKLCLAIPAKVLEVKGNVAKVDFGQGVAREVNVMLVDAKVGEYVLVHAGYAIEKMDQKAAEESLETWRQVLEQS